MNKLKAPIKVVQELGGHTLPTTPLNIYTDDAESEMKRHYLDEAEDLLFGA